eukprot:m.251050 g.251050  ORF g.251050 m.251050 type:complete len:235 (+) comp17015_c0_seq1:27-731(+)
MAGSLCVSVPLLLAAIVAVASCALAQPVAPVFPAVYDTLQLSSCVFESVYCPAGFVNQTIASHSYYDYPGRRMVGVDANDVAINGTIFAADQTFITYNATSAHTEIYGFGVGATALSCVATDYPGAMIPPDFLQQPGATYVGLAMWNNIRCYHWTAPPAYGSMSWYTAADATQRWVGFATPDGSQVGYFEFFRAQAALPARVFVKPAGVACVGTERRRRGVHALAPLIAGKMAV